jgi:hypothetical protein
VNATYQRKIHWKSMERKTREPFTMGGKWRDDDIGDLGSALADFASEKEDDFAGVD